MAITVIATPGASNANSFQTVADIDLYYAGRAPLSVAEEWLDADSDEKDAAAVMATTWMTSLIVWSGFPYSASQSLPWPRTSMLDREGLNYISATTNPRELKNAHAEFARLLLSTDRTEESDVIAQGIERLKAGPIDISFREDSYQAAPIFPAFIIGLLVPSWIRSVSDQRIMNRELERA